MISEAIADSRKQAATSYEALIISARTLFSQKGYADAGIREIAANAGVTIGTLYYYAPSKEGLFLRLVLDSYSASTKELRAAVARESSHIGKLKALVLTHIRNEVQDHDLWALALAATKVLSPEGRASFQRARDEFEDVWRSVINDGAEAGEFQVSHPRVARMSLIKICNGVADWFNPAGELNLEEVSEVVYSQALALVGASARH